MHHLGIAVGLVACLGILAPAVGPAATQVSLGDPGLDQALRQAGWDVRWAEGGGLLLFPPQVSHEAGAGRDAQHRDVKVSQEAGAVRDAQHKDVQASQEAGAGRDAQHKDVQASQEAGAGRDEQEGAVAAVGRETPAAAAPDAGAGDLGRMTGPDWYRLRNLGWRVEADADGATLLYPPISKAVAPAGQAAPVAQPEKTLDSLLQERGWRVERDAKGALLLHPHRIGKAPPAAAMLREGQAAAATGPAGPKGAEGGLALAKGAETAPVRDAAIALPVDRWAEARVIAEAWLAEHGAPGWRVGKIRQIHRVYLVSIIDSARPPRVVHQIAITGGNGRVVVLN